MSTELIINASLPETRIALMENGEIQELLIERPSGKGIVGNIYKGRVTRVLPGMQAAFVDIGLEKAAFLYVDDVFVHPEIWEEEEGAAREPHPLAEEGAPQPVEAVAGAEGQPVEAPAQEGASEAAAEAS
ncbi:MAG: Rne/Rng family ribonuclease, partial [Bdellovibrionota bacterium]